MIGKVQLVSTTYGEYSHRLRKRCQLLGVERPTDEEVYWAWCRELVRHGAIDYSADTIAIVKKRAEKIKRRERYLQKKANKRKGL